VAPGRASASAVRGLCFRDPPRPICVGRPPGGARGGLSAAAWCAGGSPRFLAPRGVVSGLAPQVGRSLPARTGSGAGSHTTVWGESRWRPGLDTRRRPWSEGGAGGTERWGCAFGPYGRPPRGRRSSGVGARARRGDRGAGGLWAGPRVGGEEGVVRARCGPYVVGGWGGGVVRGVFFFQHRPAADSPENSEHRSGSPSPHQEESKRTRLLFSSATSLIVLLKRRLADPLSSRFFFPVAVFFREAALNKKYTISIGFFPMVTPSLSWCVRGHSLPTVDP